MQFEHGAAFNLDFMLAACKMNEAERKALVEVFDPKRTNAVNNTGMNMNSKPIEEQNIPSAVDKNSSKSEPQTPKKRGNSSNSNEDGPHTPRKVLFPNKRETSAPPTPGKRIAPKTPRKRDSSLPAAASTKSPKTPNKKRSPPSESNSVKSPLKKSPSISAQSLKKLPGNRNAPKTPGKRDSSTPSGSKKGPKNPSKKQLASADREDPANSAHSFKNSPKTPTKKGQPSKNVSQSDPILISKQITPKKTINLKNSKPKTLFKKELSSIDSSENEELKNEKKPASAIKNTQSNTSVGKKEPKTPKKSGKPNSNISKNEITPSKKREHSLSVEASKDSKKAKHEDQDSDGLIIVNDPSLIPCKLCPLSFRFKKEYREHLKMHKKETHEKIENTKKEIEELQKNITPNKNSKLPNPRKKPEKDSIDLPANDLSPPNSTIKKSPRLAAKENNWQCGLSDGLGSRCKEVFNVRRALRHHMNFEHRNKRQGGS